MAGVRRWIVRTPDLLTPPMCPCGTSPRAAAISEALRWYFSIAGVESIMAQY